MIAWIVVAVAAAGALVILAFAAYEVSWKLRRLRGDLDGLQQVKIQLDGTRSELLALAERVQTTRGAEPAGS